VVAMSFVRLALLMLAIGFSALIVWAIQTGDFWSEGSWLTSNPWGVVSLTDLYLGFLITAIFMYFFESSYARWFWIMPLPFLGNVWTLLWLAYRLPALYGKLYTKSLL
jgi:hypothetical protein